MTKGSLILNENKLQQAAFCSYRECRDLDVAYHQYMQDNPEALSSYTVFRGWASKFNWVKRCHEYDRGVEMEAVRRTSALKISNNTSTEEVRCEILKIALEEMELLRCELSNRDIIGYLAVADKMGSLKDPVVVVNQNQSQDTIEISEETLKELGKSLIKDES